jgi:NTE family protein
MNSDSNDVVEKKIKHLVISGGFIYGVSVYACMDELIRNGFLDMNHIQSIYGTSVGALFAVVLSLKYDYETIENYIVNRPWYDICKITTDSFLNLFNKRGIFDIKIMENILFPLLKGRNFDPNITMKELYVATGIDIRIYAIEINQYTLVEFSHDSRGDWRVVDVVYASCSIPLLFSPLICGSECFIDGSLLLNYPLEKCAEIQDTDEILGIYLAQFFKMPAFFIHEQTPLTDFIITLFNQIVANKFSNTIKEKVNIKYEIEFAISYSIMDIYETIHKREKRQELMDDGRKIAKTWLFGHGFGELI